MQDMFCREGFKNCDKSLETVKLYVYREKIVRKRRNLLELQKIVNKLLKSKSETFLDQIFERTSKAAEICGKSSKKNCIRSMLFF